MKTVSELLFGGNKEKSERASRELFQVEEFEGKFWLTYAGALVCPTDMFKDEPIKALMEIRKLYVERNTEKT